MSQVNNSHKKNNSGFTLIEMLVVVAIIGILATVVLFSVGRARKRAIAVQMKAHMEELMKAAMMAEVDGCTYLQILTNGCARCSGGPFSGTVYIEKVPRAPKKQSGEYQYYLAYDGSLHYISNNNSEVAAQNINLDTDYYFRACYFGDHSNFYCKNGSCYCNIDGGCSSM